MIIETTKKIKDLYEVKNIVKVYENLFENINIDIEKINKKIKKEQQKLDMLNAVFNKIESTKDNGITLYDLVMSFADNEGLEYFDMLCQHKDSSYHAYMYDNGKQCYYMHYMNKYIQYVNSLIESDYIVRYINPKNRKTMYVTKKYFLDFITKNYNL